MQGWKILKHSWQQIYANMVAALRISAILHVAIVAAGLYFTIAAGDGLRDGTWVANSGVWLPYTVNMVVASVAGLWIAVAWHRYILTGEITDGWIPKLHMGRMWVYFWRGVLIMLAVMVPLVFGAVLLSFMQMYANSISPNLAPLTSVIPMLLIIPMFFAMFRLSPILPAAALGKDLSLKEAWIATKGSTGPIVLIMLLMAVFYGFSGFVMQPYVLEVSAFAILWNLIVGWVLTMLGISVLTTIYGHYVEGRELI